MKSHSFIDARPRFRENFSPKNLKKALDEVGNPENSFKTVQVAGTNGKGSVSKMVAQGLPRCGLYTSPHFRDINERFVVEGKQISDEELLSLADEFKPLAEKHNLSYFETLTGMALVYFAKKNCEYSVLEVGMGGRLDATSAVDPIISIITNIDYDHMEFLGESIEKIAYEKAGIIKNNIVITTVKKSEALKVIETKCALECATLIKPVLHNFNLRMPGEFQQYNAACAYGALLALGIDESHAKNAVETAYWPGRLDQRGRILFDCAHNPAGLQELAKYLSGKDFQLVFAMKETKDHENSVRIIAPLAKKVFVTQFTEAPYSLPAKELFPIVKKYNSNCELVENPRDALAKTQSFIVVTGSIFLVGELMDPASR